MFLYMISQVLKKSKSFPSILAWYSSLNICDLKMDFNSAIEYCLPVCLFLYIIFFAARIVLSFIHSRFPVPIIFSILEIFTSPSTSVLNQYSISFQNFLTVSHNMKACSTVSSAIPIF